MKISHHDCSDQNDHGYQYFHGIVKCTGDVQKVPTHKSLQFLYKKNQQIK